MPLKRTAPDRLRSYILVTGILLTVSLSLSFGTAATGQDTVPVEIRVLMLGDSLTSGLGVMPEQAWPALVQERVDREMKARGRSDRVRIDNRVRIINGGISGSTTASAASRIKWYLKSPPKVMILALGANDGLRGLALDQTRQHLDAAIRMAQKAGIRVILAGMEIPPNMGPDYTAEFRRIFPDLAAAHHIPLIPFLLKGVAGHPELNQADGIHPNARGHEIVAETVFPFVMEALDAGT